MPNLKQLLSSLRKLVRVGKYKILIYKNYIEGVNFCIDIVHNIERPHMSINMMTPVEAGHCLGEIPQKWENLRQIIIKEKRKEEDFPEKTLPSLYPDEELPKGNFLQGQNAIVNSFQ